MPSEIKNWDQISILRLKVDCLGEFGYLAVCYLGGVGGC